jgi:glycosyltransferase involved in cell wall biosynthesis
VTERTDLAVLLASIPMGGVGKMRVHLVNEIARRGYRVELVLADLDSPYMGMVDSSIRKTKIPTSHALMGVPSVAAYLLRARPRVLLTQRIRVNILGLRAHALVRSSARRFVTVNVNMTSKLAGHSPAKRAVELARLKRYYPRNDGIIAVSRGVAQDAAALIGCPLERIHVCPNPTVTPELTRLAAEPLDHPWFAAGCPPVVLGVGRLFPQKDFPTLIRAFATLRAKRACRLVILGEGPQRPNLEALVAELGLAADVQLPGFVSNPYQYMGRAGVFVLSSLFEGLPNALTEALAVGAPLVSTDCPDGPREILEDGKHGSLVPVGDVETLSQAIARALDSPSPRAQRQAAAQRYTIERSASAYIDALGL